MLQRACSRVRTSVVRPLNFSTSPLIKHEIRKRLDEKSQKRQWTTREMEEVIECMSLENRQQFEAILRSRRKEKISLNLDPKEYARLQKPSNKTLRVVFIHHAIPFIGFGFLDNFIMILAGEYIEHTIGLTFHFSVMACAALGNTISDVCGIGLAGYVEIMCVKMGLPVPTLTPAESNHSRTRWAKGLGQAVGIIIGCTIGMFPLLFLDHEISPP